MYKIIKVEYRSAAFSPGSADSNLFLLFLIRNRRTIIRVGIRHPFYFHFQMVKSIRSQPQRFLCDVIFFF